MRLLSLIVLAGCGFDVVGAGGGGDDTPPIDAPPDTVDAYLEPDPRILPGGGIDDGPIAGVVHVHVVDRISHAPLAGVAVDVGGVTGMTSDAGLFTARAASLSGKTSVLATRAGYRAAYWVGVQGVNVTIALEPSPVTTIPSGTVSGTISGFAGIPVGMGHVKRGVVSYSQDDLAMEPVNSLPTPGNTHVCLAPNCAYTVRTRTGRVALLARIDDVDTLGNGNPNDDVRTTTGYAYATGLTVTDGSMQTGLLLPQIQPNQMMNITADFGTLPAGMTFAFGFVGLELGADGVVYLGDYPSTAGLTIRGPAITAIPTATGYRFAAVAGSGTGAPSSVVIRRAVQSIPLVAGSWPLPPTGVTATRTMVSFVPPAGARYTAIDVQTRGNNPTQALQILVFDDTTSVTLPTAVTLPTVALRTNVSAVRTTADLTGFTFDEDADLSDGYGTAGADVD